MRRPSRPLLAALLLLAVLGATLPAWAVLRARDQDRRDAIRDGREQRTLATVRAAVDHALDGHRDLARVLTAAPASIVRRWPVLARTVLDEPTTARVAFIERIRHAHRAAYERRTGMPIVVSRPGLRPILASRRDDYLVATHVAGRGNPLRNVDIGQLPSRRRLLARAERTGRMVASPPVTLLGSRDRQRGVVVWSPVADAGSGRIRGWLATTYEASRLMSVLRHETRSTPVRIEDDGAVIAGPRTLRGGRSSSLVVGGRRWAITARAPLPPSSPTPWLVLVLGLTGAGIIAGIVFVFAHREGYARRLLARRDEERDVAEAELRRSREELASVVDVLGEGLVVVEPDGRFGHVNRVGREVLGLPATGEAPSIAEWVVHDEAGRRLPVQDQPAAITLATGRPFDDVVLDVLREDGERRWISVTTRAVGDRPPHRVVCSIEDITSRRAAEAALAASEERYRTTVEQLEEGIVLQSADFAVTTSNAAAERILGVSPAQLAGGEAVPEGWRAIRVDGSPCPPGAMPNAQALKTGEPQLGVVLGLRKPDGSVTWVAVNARPLRREGEEGPYAVVCSFSDITQMRAAEAALLRQRAELADAQAIAQLGSLRWDDAGGGDWSDELCRILGMEPGESPESHGAFMGFVYPGDRHHVDAEMTRPWPNDRAVIDHRIVRQDGFVRHVTTTLRVVRDAEGRRTGVVGTCQDVTEQRAAQRLLEDSEARFRSLAEHAPVAIFETDRDGRCTWVNETWESMTGMGRVAAINEGWLSRIHPEDRDEVLGHWERSMLRQQPFELPFRFLSLDGSTIHVIGTAAALRDSDDRVTGYIGTVLDVSASHAAERGRREAEQRFRSAFGEAPIGMALVSPDGRIIESNGALGELVGYGPERLEGMELAAVTHPEDAGRERAVLAGMLRGDANVHEAEHRLVHAAGHAVWVSATATLVRDDDGDPRHFLVQLQDVTERRRYEERLQYMADHDPLTGLLNRRSFERELDRQVTRVQRYGDAGAVLALDLDHFKAVNDTLGHNAGDKLIVEISQRLESRLRDSDVLARLGGDEFAVLLPNASADEAMQVAEDLLLIVNEAEVPSAARPRRATASIGVVAVQQREGLTGEDLLVCADLAMYDAKEAGRNQVALYAAGPHDRARTEARLAWVERIRDALDAGDFVLHAQPIVDLSTGAISQYELLVRMVSESGDLIPPGSFLYIAERYDLVQELDRWVIVRAIEMLAKLQAAGRSTAIEVNVSGRSLGDQSLMAAIEATLARTGADPSGLILEITETAAVANIPQAQAFGQRLSELGCRFALDDFGAGFGSFYYLKHLPFDILKIDGEFVRNCRANSVDRLVIESVVTIARGMGKQTVAEFVGDDDTVDLLRSYGVDLAQGFHLGRPGPLDDMLVVQPQRNPTGVSSGSSGLTGRSAAGSSAS